VSVAPKKRVPSEEGEVKTPAANTATNTTAATVGMYVCMYVCMRNAVYLHLYIICVCVILLLFSVCSEQCPERNQ